MQWNSCSSESAKYGSVYRESQGQLQMLWVLRLGSHKHGKSGTEADVNFPVELRECFEFTVDVECMMAGELEGEV